MIVMRQRLDVKVGGTLAPKLAVSADGNVTGLLLESTQMPRVPPRPSLNPRMGVAPRVSAGRG